MTGPVDRIALVDGIAARFLDFDDTHLQTVFRQACRQCLGCFAAALVCGHREQFGSMTKSLHAGAAACTA